MSQPRSRVFHPRAALLQGIQDLREGLVIGCRVCLLKQATRATCHRLLHGHPRQHTRRFGRGVKNGTFFPAIGWGVGGPDLSLKRALTTSIFSYLAVRWWLCASPIDYCFNMSRSLDQFLLPPL